MSHLPGFLRHSLMAANGDTPTGQGTPGRSLDFECPGDNLYAFGKLWATYDDAPVFSAFHGTMFGAVEGQRLKPLFR